ncbi:hypothetical protein JYT74_03125 [Crocinitomix catalasitica]|nr:hypothetical protein [Crocinitomix catalasitica]
MKTILFLFVIHSSFGLWSQSTNISIEYLDSSDYPEVYEQAKKLWSLIERKRFSQIAKRLEDGKDEDKWRGSELRRRVRWMAELITENGIPPCFVGQQSSLADWSALNKIMMCKTVQDGYESIMVSLHYHRKDISNKADVINLSFTPYGVLTKISLSVSEKALKKFADEDEPRKNAHPILSGQKLDPIDAYRLEGKWELNRVDFVNQDKNGAEKATTAIDMNQMKKQWLQFEANGNVKIKTESRKGPTEEKLTFYVRENTVHMLQGFLRSDRYLVERLDNNELVLLTYHTGLYTSRQRKYYLRTEPTDFDRNTFESRQKELIEEPIFPKEIKHGILQTYGSRFYFTPDGTKTIGWPYTGLLYQEDNKGNRVTETEITDGYKSGKYTSWHEGYVYLTGYYLQGKMNGVWTYYHDASTMSNLVTYKNGTLDGPYKCWFKNGNLFTEVVYELGKVHGNSHEYTETGELFKTTQFEYGKLTGEWYHSIGDEISIDDMTQKDGIYYLNGLAYSGKATSFFKTDDRNPQLIRQEISLTGGLFHGPYTERFENDALRKVGQYKNGEKDGNWKIYHKSGFLWQTMDWENGKKNGYQTHLSKKGVMFSKTGWKNDLRDGSHTQWEYDGSKIVETGFYSKGKRHGRWVYQKWRYEYFDNGIQVGTHIEFNDRTVEHFETDHHTRVERRFFKDDYSGNSCEFTSFWDNGFMKEQGMMRSGYIRTGLWKTHRQDKSLESDGEYNINGKKQNNWRYYDKQGRLFNVETYDHSGKLISTKQSGAIAGCSEKLKNQPIRSTDQIVSIKDLFACNGDFYYNRNLFRGWAYYGTTYAQYYEAGQATEKIKRWWKNGKIQEESEKRDGSYLGQLTRWYESGQIHQSGFYENGHAIKFESWYKDGRKEKHHWIENGIRNQDSWYKNGQKKEEKHFINRKEEHGLWRGWHENGSRKYVKNYSYGRAVGEWKSWTDDSTLIMLATAKNGYMIGKYQSWYTTGQQHISGTWAAEGIKDGEWKEWHPNGNLSIQEFYSNGKIEGEAIKWNADGTIFKRGNWSKGLEEGIHVQERFGRVERQETSYLHGIKHGSNKLWHSNGQLKIEENFLYGLLQGQRLTYFETGVKKTIEYYEKGEASGKWTYFHATGKKSMEFSHDEGLSVYKEYYDNGKIRTKGFRLNNQRDSLWRRYHPNGKISEIGSYRKGSKYGRWKSYDAAGNLINEKIHQGVEKSAIRKKYSLSTLDYGDFGLLIRLPRWHAYEKSLLRNARVKSDTVELFLEDTEDLGGIVQLESDGMTEISLRQKVESSFVIRKHNGRLPFCDWKPVQSKWRDMETMEGGIYLFHDFDPVATDHWNVDEIIEKLRADKDLTYPQEQEYIDLMRNADHRAVAMRSIISFVYIEISGLDKKEENFKRILKFNFSYGC